MYSVTFETYISEEMIMDNDLKLFIGDTLSGYKSSLYLLEFLSKTNVSLNTTRKRKTQKITIFLKRLVHLRAPDHSKNRRVYPNLYSY